MMSAASFPDDVDSRESIRQFRVFESFRNVFNVDLLKDKTQSISDLSFPKDCRKSGSISEAQENTRTWNELASGFAIGGAATRAECQRAQPDRDNHRF